MRFLLRLLAVSLFALIVTCTGCQPGPARSPAPAISASRALESTIALVTPRHALVCAGQFVGPRLILTAAHCVPDAVGCIDESDVKCQVGARADYVTFQSWRGAMVRYDAADVLAVDRSVDLALLVARRPSPIWVNVALGAPAVGDLVYNVGHPNGDVWTVCLGFAVDPTYTPTRERISIRIWFGNSGGGLYDQDGALIGVASQMDTDNPDQPAVVGLYVPVPVIRDFIASATAPASSR